jgi:hypothetical protein
MASQIPPKHATKQAANQSPNRSLPPDHCGLVLDDHKVVGGNKIGYPNNHITTMMVARAEARVFRPHVAIRIYFPLKEYKAAAFFDVHDQQKTYNKSSSSCTLAHSP